MDNAKLAKKIEKDWPLRVGKREYINALRGKELSWKEQVMAQHYICCGGFIDETYDCKGYKCPAYQSQPYRENVSKTSDKPKKVLSEAHKAKLKAGRKTKVKNDTKV